MTEQERKQTAVRYRNGVNNAQGHFFEDSIMTACKIYSQRERAVIDKTPEPFRVTSKSKNGTFTGRFTAHAQPDFQGTLASGISIVFEAKYTTTERMKRDVLTTTQMELLEQHKQMGAITAVCVGIQSSFYFVPWDIWRDMKEHYGRKYVTQGDLEPYRVMFTGAVMFLDYVNGGDR